MRRMLIALVTLLVLAACGSDGEGRSEAEAKERSTTTTSTTTTTPTTTTVVPTSTAAPVVTTAPAVAPPPAAVQTCKSPDEAAASLHDAWASGDQSAAARCAVPDAVSALFSGSGGPAAGEYFAGCFGQASPVTCSYAYTGGGINFTIECAASLGTGCQVTGVSFVAD